MTRRMIGLTVLTVGVVAVASFTVAMVMVIYPGVLKLTAPSLCPDDMPDAFVVSFTSQAPDGGTSTDISLFCMGERGQFTEIGLAAPYLRLTGVATAGLAVLVVLGAVRVRVGRRRRSRPRVAAPRAGAPGPGPVDAPWGTPTDRVTAGPLVDPPVDRPVVDPPV
ncbi:MAG TPA: hypothetical protein VFZ79_05215 [Acidimicrobiales bacterium]